MQRYTQRRIVLWLIRIYGPVAMPTMVIKARPFGITLRDTNAYITEHLRDKLVTWVEVDGRQRLDVTARGRALCPACGETPSIAVWNPKVSPPRQLADAVKWMWGGR